MATPGDHLPVLLDTTPLVGPRTGVARLVAAIVQRGAAHGIDVVPYLVSRRAPAGPLGELPEPVRVPLPAVAALWAWRFLDRPARRDLGIDAALVHGTNFSVLPGSGRPELVTVHDVGPWRDPTLDRPRPWFPALVARALRRGAHLHVVSGVVAGEVAEATGVDPSRVHVVPNGVDPWEGGDAGTGRRRAGGRPYLVAIGSHERRKRLPDLVDALAALRSTHDVDLVVVGGEGPDTPAIRAAIDHHHLDGHVHLRGFVEDGVRRDLLAGAEALAFPSDYEGFGLPPLEAMAAGIPAVVADAPAVVEAVADAAVVVPVGDVDALAGALVRVLDDREHRDDLVERGRRRAAASSWDHSVARLAELYRTLADAAA